MVCTRYAILLLKIDGARSHDLVLLTLNRRLLRCHVLPPLVCAPLSLAAWYVVFAAAVIRTLALIDALRKQPRLNARTALEQIQWQGFEQGWPIVPTVGSAP